MLGTSFTTPCPTRNSSTRWLALSLGAALTFTLVGCQGAGAPETGCEGSTGVKIPQPTAAQLEAAGFETYPLAPDAERVDLSASPFSHSTAVTNPLFPISALRSVVLNGHVDGKDFRTETTLMSQTNIIEWSAGQCVRTVTSQYTAYLDGRIEEVALDHYAQADDGSVWYLGEDVYNYSDGIIAETSGTWRAGKDGPAAMIMPGKPEVGQAFRPENIPGMVFEEVIVSSVDAVVDGPRGPVSGAMIATEVHSDGSTSDKIFAPGYGEFSSAHDGDLEAMALAVPMDSLDAPIPDPLAVMREGAIATFTAVGMQDWSEAATAVESVSAAWQAHRTTDGVPPRLVAPADDALAILTERVAAQDTGAQDAALEVLQATLDLLLQYQPADEIDVARFELWTHRVTSDAAAGDLNGAVGDVTTLEWIRDRIARTFEAIELTRVDLLLEELRTNTVDGDLDAAAATAIELLEETKTSSARP